MLFRPNNQGRALRMQKRGKYTPWACDGTIWRDHVGYLETLNKRLYEIELEPIARPYNEFYHKDDIYLANMDLYKTKRTEYIKRTSEKDHIYYKELKRIAREMLDTEIKTKQYIEETIPNFKRFYWTPAPNIDPLNYGLELANYKRQKYQQQYHKYHKQDDSIALTESQQQLLQQIKEDTGYHQFKRDGSPSSRSSPSRPQIVQAAVPQAKKQLLINGIAPNGQLTASHIK